MNDSIFSEVKRALNIKQVMSFYGVKIERNNTFCCPFHNEKHPSASIKNDYFNCFVCGAGGDLISFTAKTFGLSNIDACKRLIEDFKLNISINKPISQKDRLRADRESQKRKTEQKKREQLEELIQHTGIVLADYHRILWQGIHLYPLEDERHIRGLQYLTQAQYYLACYDENAEEFTIKNNKAVRKFERLILEWNDKGQ